MPDALVAADLDLALDVLRHIAAQVTFDREVGVDPATDAIDLFLGQVADPSVGIDADFGADLARGRPADAEDVGERDLQPLLAGDVDAGDAGHVRSASCSLSVALSALTLLVAGVLADDHDATVGTDHLALLTDCFDARADLHRTSASVSGLLVRGLLVAIRDATTAEVVRRELNLDAISGKDSDVVHPHLPADVGEHLVAVLELDPEHGVGERLDHRAFQHDRIFLGLRQNDTPRIWPTGRRGTARTILTI